MKLNAWIAVVEPRRSVLLEVIESTFAPRTT